MKFTTMKQVQEYLIQFTPKPDDTLSFEQKFERMKYFMRLLGDPQNKIKVVHIAGTSGKGSTSYIMSALLHKLGHKVGLCVSPHLYDLRERTQIDNKLISEEKYCRYLDAIYPFIEEMDASGQGVPSFFEISMALSFYAFWSERVDYAVMETGLGGRYDATNTAISPDKLCLITKIGYDHMDFLGDTIELIATEKAHIMQPGNISFSVPQMPEAEQVLLKVAKQKKAHLTFIELKNDFRTSLQGEYQQENISLAVAGLYTLAKRDAFAYDGDVIRKTLMKLSFAGRFQKIEKAGKTVILDGAHNPQKIEAFIGSLKKNYPDRKFDFLLAFKQGKHYDEMLPFIIPLARKITVTEFTISGQGMGGESEEAEDVVAAVNKLGLNNTKIVKDSQKALEEALESAEDILVVTGSLYLLSAVGTIATTNGSN